MRQTAFLRSLSSVAIAALALSAAHSCDAFGWPGYNDEIFPPGAAAKKAINFDNHGFLINGKRTFILGGDLQYNRIPRAMWRDRILRIKRAGYNTIQTYVFWNFHEPEEGQFNFSGDHDLDAFLKLAKSLDMYAIVRIGPYVNADADSGGLPLWLRFNKPGLLPMSDDKPFYDAVEPYWRKLMPIVAANQINRGGNVIMVQLENENTHGTGTDTPEGYYKTYLKFAQGQGLVVPMFFSGLNHNDDPAGPDPIDTSQRHSPWMSSEFWTGWIAVYGVAPDRGIKLDRTTWGIIAYGGAGYSHYEMAGGTDFGTLACDEDGASYDFGAPIGQAGDLRFDYYLVKRSAMFASSFPAILADSAATNDGLGSTLTNSNLRLTNRKGPAGSILFIDNTSGSVQTVQIKTADGKLFPAAGPMTIQANEFVPIVQNFKLDQNISLDLAASRILGVTHVGNVTKMVVYGSPGEPIELHFGTGNVTSQVLSQPKAANAISTSKGSVKLTATIPTGKPAVYSFKVGDNTVQVIAENGDLADRTWFIPVNGATHIVTGPDYVGEASETGGKLTLDSEIHALNGPYKFYPTLDFAQDGLHSLSITGGSLSDQPISGPNLTNWHADSTVPQAQPAYNDSKWMASSDPPPMGADGCYDAYAWYRTTIHFDKSGPVELYIPDAGDWLSCFVNGKHVDTTDVEQRYQGPIPRYLHFTATAGDSKVAILAAHYGRNKLVEYYGPMDTIDRKGIGGPVSLNTNPTTQTSITGLRWIADDAGETNAPKYATATLDITTAGWADYHYDDVFHGRLGSVWICGNLPNVSGKHHKLTFQNVDDICYVYVNGQKVGDHAGAGQPFTMDLDSAWKDGSTNKIAIDVVNTGGPGGIFGSFDLTSGPMDAEGPTIHNWRMQGGEVPPSDNSPTWQATTGTTATGVPTWYRADFIMPASSGPHPILRATWAGLTRGFVWLNGHNLGRYPDRANIDGLYLPECSINKGHNTLEVFDEEGAAPNQCRLEVNVPESRTDLVLKG